MMGTHIILKHNPDYLLQVFLKGAASVIVFSIIAYNLKRIGGWETLYVMMAFCLVGEIVLASEKISANPALMFQIGLASYFISYLILAILLRVKGRGVHWSVQLVILIVAIGVGLFQYTKLTRLTTDMAGMAPMVLAYLAMTIILIYGALCYLLSNNAAGGWLFIAGFMFYLSDSLIGQKVFGSMNSQMMEIPIMLTYAIGHVSLLLGTFYLKHRACESIKDKS
jgi:hypothetical protein